MSEPPGQNEGMTQPVGLGGRPMTPPPGVPAEERLVARFHRHARHLFWSALVLVVVCGAAAYFYDNLPAPFENWMLLAGGVALIVLLVLVLRHLPKYFTNRPLRGVRWLRALIAAGVGLAAGLAAIAAANARSQQSISDRFFDLAYELGYGKNIVNVTLVDIRAWDTVGEISVLLAAATGVASLIFIRTRVVDPVGTLRGRRGRPEMKGGPGWLRAGFSVDMHRRAPMLEMMTRLLFPVMLVVAVYLLFAGHNDPGGGFIAGIVAGLALCVRYLAAGALELAEAAPIDAGKLLGGGIILSALSLIAPVFFGGSVGQSYEFNLDVIAMGEIHFVTSVFFDIGVFLVVLGTVLDFIRSLGSGIDSQWRNDLTPRPAAHSDRTVPAKPSLDVAQAN